MRALKLYYDIDLDGMSASVLINPLTDEDRFGNTLHGELGALTAGASGLAKAQRELTAFFQPALQLPAQNQVGHAITTPVFVDWRRSAGGLLAVYLTAGGASVPEKIGLTSIYTQNPRVQVGYGGSGRATGQSGHLRGTLYVQRQHSIEC